MLISAEASPLELFENILTQQEAREKPHLLERPGIIVDDNLGFSKVRWCRLESMETVPFWVLLTIINTHIDPSLPGSYDISADRNAVT